MRIDCTHVHQAYHFMLTPFSLCKQLALNVFSQFQQTFSQIFKSLRDYIWKLFYSSQNKGAEQGLNMPIDVFAHYLVPHLSVQDVHSLVLANKAGLKLRDTQCVLDKLFSSPRVNVTTLASAVGPSMKEVTRMKLGSRPISFETLKALFRGSPNLQDLDLSHNSKLTDDVIRVLANSCPSLTTLNLTSIILFPSQSKEIAKLFQRCPNLKNLYLSHFPEGIDTIIEALVQYRLQPNNLDLSFAWMTNASAELLAKHCSDLNRLNLSRSYMSVPTIRAITDEMIQTLAQKNPNLVELNLNGCANITDAAIEALAKHCPNLQKLDLSQCPQVTGAAIQNLALNCPNLITINLGGCKDINDSTIQALAANCPHLLGLGLRACLITNAAIELLAQRYPNLLSLNLQECTQITDPAIQNLSTSCRYLKRLELTRSQALIEGLKRSHPNLQLSHHLPLAKLTYSIDWKS